MINAKASIAILCTHTIESVGVEGRECLTKPESHLTCGILGLRGKQSSVRFLTGANFYT